MSITKDFLPSALILLACYLVSPCKQQPKCCQLLRVKVFFLPPVEIKVGFICKEGLDVFLDRKKRNTRELSVLPLSDTESYTDMRGLNTLVQCVFELFILNYR